MGQVLKFQMSKMVFPSVRVSKTILVLKPGLFHEKASDQGRWSNLDGLKEGLKLIGLLQA